MIAHALEETDVWRARRTAAGALLVGLDFDGTLAPIVDRPGQAMLPADTAAALRALAARPDTIVAIVSGRALDDVAERVALEGLFHAGNHGFEIRGPGVDRVHPRALAARPALAAIAECLRRRLVETPGALVEDKGLTLSVHYRLVPESDASAVRAAVHACATGVPGIRLTEGKKVIEVRPDVDWDKGAAMDFLRTTLHGDHAVPTLYIGDDRTDEDAFRMLAPDGGVLVTADPGVDTAAGAYLASTREVARFLDRLAR